MAAWVRDARRIGGNCLRFNTQPWIPGLRDAAKGYLVALEKELESKVRPVMQLVGADARACPRLLKGTEKIMKALEEQILSVGKESRVQLAFPFLHPIESQRAARKPSRKASSDAHASARVARGQEHRPISSNIEGTTPAAARRRRCGTTGPTWPSPRA